jgi:hypothetical protein
MNGVYDTNYGNCKTWFPYDSKEELTITPYRAISYAIGNENEEIGNITITSINDDLFIDVINVWTSYLNKGYESLLVRYIQETHDKTLYIKPANSSQVQWLAELGFEPLYVEDWSPNSLQAPWESGYKQMIYIPNPSKPMILASFEKRFLMALSNYISDIITFTPEVNETDSNELTWKYNNKEFKSYTDKALNIINCCIFSEEGIKTYINISTYTNIQTLAKWFVSDVNISALKDISNSYN